MKQMIYPEHTLLNQKLYNRAYMSSDMLFGRTPGHLADGNMKYMMITRDGWSPCFAYPL